MKKFRILVVLLFCCILVTAQQSIVGQVQSVNGNVITFSGVVPNNPGQATGADPCQVPQMYLDALGTFAGLLDEGGAQNQPVQPIPGTSVDQAVSGLQYFLANSWYQICQIHILTAKLSSDETTMASLQSAVNSLNNTQTTINNLQTQEISDSTNISNLQTSLSALQTQVAGLSGSGMTFSNITWNCPSLSNCSIVFNTSVSAIGYARYGTTLTATNAPPAETAFVTSHTIKIAPSYKSTVYFYYVCAVDQNNNLKCSPQPPVNPLQFTTPAQ